jgi:hypothetical protein
MVGRVIGMCAVLLVWVWIAWWVGSWLGGVLADPLQCLAGWISC